MVYLHLPDYREPNTKPLDIVGLILFGSGIALLSYVLEIFGEHTLGPGEILGLLALSVALIVGYGLHAMGMAFPLLQLSLFRIRTFGAARERQLLHPARHRWACRSSYRSSIKSASASTRFNRACSSCPRRSAL